MPKRPNGPFFADKCVPSPRAVRQPRPPLPTAPPWLGTHDERRPWLSIGRQTDDVSDERRDAGHEPGRGRRWKGHSPVEKEGRWGIGSLTTSCPRCRTPMSALRRPTSIAEGMWGGWTCPTCGCKV